MDAPQNNLDPSNWLGVLFGGVLVGLGRWLFDRLRGVPRPSDGEHTSAYIAEQVRLIADKLDRMEARQEDFDARLLRIELRRATSGD